MKIRTYRRGAEAQRKRREHPLFSKIFSAKPLRLCVSAVGVKAFFHSL
jgi:hypothetical protein